MNLRTVLALAAGLVALVVVLLITGQRGDRAPAPGERLFATMRSDINAITTVAVTAAGNKKIATLTRQDEGWSVAERNGYPADTGKLRRLLLALADARLVEAKTANPAFYARLGVEDVSAESAGGVLILATSATGQYGVIVGDQAQGEYRYVRRQSETGSWLIDTSPAPSQETTDWLDATVIDIDAGLVHSATIEHPDGQTIRLVKARREASDFTVIDIPAGRELQYAGVGNVVGGVLDNLALDDVSPSAEIGPQAVTTRFETFDGRVIRVSSEAAEGKYWIQLSASYNVELAKQLALPGDDKPVAGEPAAEDPETDPQTSSESVISDTVAVLNLRTHKWRYQIPQYKYEQLTRRWQDLLKAVE